MWVDWVKKTIIYKWKGARIKLKGLRTKLQKCEPISLVELQALADERALEHIVQLNVSSSGEPEVVPMEIEQCYKNITLVSTYPQVCLHGGNSIIASHYCQVYKL
jgi:hypothetical protein